MDLSRDYDIRSVTVHNNIGYVELWVGGFGRPLKLADADNLSRMIEQKYELVRREEREAIVEMIRTALELPTAPALWLRDAILNGEHLERAGDE